MIRLHGRFRRWVVAVATVAGALACGQAQAADIELWTTEVEPSRIHTIEYLMNAFSVLESGDRVRVVGVDENDLIEWVVAAAEAGKPPAVIDADSQLLAALAGRGILDSGAATDLVQEIGPDRFFRAPLRIFTDSQGAGQYAIPFHGWIQAIWYRVDWFRDANLEPPTNWQSILKAAEYFSDPARERYGILVGTDTDMYAEQVFTQLARSNKVLAVDEADAKGYSSEAMVETLEYYKKLAALGPSGPQTWRARDLYLEGHMAMIFYSTHFLGNLGLPAEKGTGSVNGGQPVDALFTKTALVPVISNRTDGAYGAVNGLAITVQPDGDQAAAAKALVRFLLRPDSYVEWLHMAPGGMLPALRDIAESDAFFRDPKGIFRRFGWKRVRALIETFDSADILGAREQSRVLDKARVMKDRIVPRMIHNVVLGDRPAEEVVAWARAKVEQLLKRQEAY